MKDTKISIFKHLYQTKDVPYGLTLEKAFDRIKNGAKSVELINKIRAEKDHEKRNELKRELPCYIFAGEFKERNSQGLVSHSGACIMDFDKFPNESEMQRLFDELTKNPYVISVFKSPSGNGWKAVVRIKKCNHIEHPKYFKAFQSEFNFDYFDKSNSNVDRVCYESFDPNIFINWNAIEYAPQLKDEGYEYKEKAPLIAIDSDSEIVDMIMKWNRSKDFVEGQRNAYIFDLAGSFCEYGVSADYAEGYILNNVVIGDFTEREAKTTIKSAYRKRQFGIKYFEDYKKIKEVKKDLSKGKDEVLKKHKITDEVFDEIKIEEDQKDFWYFEKTKQGEKCKVDNLKYKKFLEGSGFKKYFPYDTQRPTWVKIVSNQVEETSVEKIKDYVLNYLLDRGEVDVWSYFASFQNLFSESFLLFLDTVELMLLKDTKDCTYIAYANGILEITKDKAELIEYVDVDGYIWKSHILPRDFVKTDSMANDYQRFVYNVSNRKPEALECTIGYLVNTYKNKMNNKAVILNDEVISDNPEGGTGKGLFVQGIKQVRRVSILDGKTFDDKKSFPYQTVSPETQVLVFDDVKKNFDFESKFSLVTEGMTLERKNKDAIKLSVEDSPKMLLSTNYAIKGEGNSHDRRRHELEIAQHYGKEKTPYDEFGKELFSDWDYLEFQRYDNYIVYCVQLYLRNGLMQQEAKNIKLRKFIMETSQDFYYWISDRNNFPFGQYLDKSATFDGFVNDYVDYKKWLNRNKFSVWVKKYASFAGYNFYETHSGSIRYFMISESDQSKKEIDISETLEPPF